MEATVRRLLGTADPQRPHTGRPPAKTAAPLPPPKARAVYPVTGETDPPVAAEAPAQRNAGGQAALPAANQPVPGNVPAAILGHMQGGTDYSRTDLLAATGIRESDWIWAIRQLKEQGKVVQTGERRGARYRIGK